MKKTCGTTMPYVYIFSRRPFQNRSNRLKDFNVKYVVSFSRKQFTSVTLIPLHGVAHRAEITSSSLCMKFKTLFLALSHLY
jgi:hypothetical protein